MGTLTLMGLGTGVASTVTVLGMAAMTTGLMAMVTNKPQPLPIYPLPGGPQRPTRMG